MLKPSGSFVLATITAPAALTSLNVATAHAQTESEIVIGRSAAGQLLARIEFGTVPLELEPSVFPGINGYATGLAGFHSTELDEADLDFFRMDEAANIEAILVSADPGIRVYNSLQVMQPGDSMLFGAPFFDYHPIFNIFDGSSGVSQVLRFRLHDLSGHHADSEVFALEFTPMFCRADFNRDGNVNPDDLGDFITGYFSEPPLPETDFNADGQTNPDDLGDFITVYFSACP